MYELSVERNFDARHAITMAPENDRVAWYENDGGSPPAFTPIVVSETIDGVRAIELADLDGDGDIDIVGGAWFGDRIAWFENQGGSPPTFVERVVWIFDNEPDPTWGIAQVWRVHAADIDGDQDLDLLAARRQFGVEWYESDGATPPTFQRRILNADLQIGYSVYAADLDDDGDMDAMSASAGDDTIAWYENLGGAPPVFTTHILTEDPGTGNGTANGARSVFAADMDGDGDADVLWGARYNHRIAWEENLLCPHDLDGTGDVGVTDLLALLAAWGTDPGGPPDFDEDGDVGVADLLALLGRWGLCD